MKDFHTHILPLLDDGAKSISDSIKIIEKEIESGVDEIYLTPHYILGRYMKSIDDIKSSYNNLIYELDKRNITIKLHLGQEIYYQEYENIIEKLNNKELLTLDNSKYVLLEFSYTNKPNDLEEILYNFKINSYKVIIAHVERYSWMDLETIKLLKAEGAFIQVNADSLLKLNSKKEYKFTKKLKKLNLIDIIASDAHIFRLPNLNKIKELYGDIKELNFEI